MATTNKCLISFDLHMRQVTSFKHVSPILPSATQTLGDILPDLPKYVKRGLSYSMA